MAQSHTEHAPTSTHVEPPSHHNTVLERIGDALRGLRYGAVTVIVQDGVVVQVDRTEKLRFAHR